METLLVSQSGGFAAVCGLYIWKERLNFSYRSLIKEAIFFLSKPDRTCGVPCSPRVQTSRAHGHLLVTFWAEIPEGKQSLHLAYDLATRHSVHFDVYTVFLVWSNANRCPFVLMCC